jgi:hypothetical protein
MEVVNTPVHSLCPSHQNPQARSYMGEMLSTLLEPPGKIGLPVVFFVPRIVSVICLLV